MATTSLLPTTLRVGVLVLLVLGGEAEVDSPVAAQQAGADVLSLADRIRVRVEGGRTVGLVPAGGRPTYAGEALSAFYIARGFTPA